MGRSLFIPKAILLDLDDTIVSFSAGAEEAWEKVSQHFVERGEVSFSSQELYEHVLSSRNWYWSDPLRHKSGREHINQARRDIMSRALGELGVFESDHSNEAADEYSDMREASMHLFEGAGEALALWQQLGIRLGLVTNGSSLIQRKKLEKFNLEHFFDIILIDQEAGVSKPDPAIYHLALQKLELASDQVMMVGDNLDWDIRGPQSAGIYAVWNDYLKEGLPESPPAVPDYTVTSIQELAKSIQKLY